MVQNVISVVSQIEMALWLQTKLQENNDGYSNSKVVDKIVTSVPLTSTKLSPMTSNIPGTTDTDRYSAEDFYDLVNYESQESKYMWQYALR